METTWRHGLYLVLQWTLLCSTTVHSETTTASPGVCGPLQLTAGSQTRYLTSPGYPGDVARNLNCKWDIEANEGERVRVVVLDVNILNLSNCKDDYVKIFDGIGVASPQLEVLCRSTQQNLEITSSTRFMRIELNTDFFVFGRGFNFMYIGGDFEVQRHHDVQDESFIVIYSPRYPNFYEGKFHLTWRIQTGSLEKIIKMVVKESKLPYNHKCGTDYVEAHDGYDSMSTSLAKWCGDEKPSKESSGPDMFIVFRASSEGSRGIFIMNYEVVPKPQEPESKTTVKTTTILLICVGVVLVPATLFGVYKIRQKRFHRSSHTNRAFVATTMASNPAVQVPHQAATAPAAETWGEIELPAYTSADPRQPPPSYESLEFGPNSGKN